MLVTHLSAILHMGDQNGLAHVRRNLIMRIVARALVFDEIVGVLHFANVVIVGHDFA